MTRALIEQRVGQVWSNRKRKPTSTFTILKIYWRRYPKTGNERQRVKGVLICGVDAVGSHLRDLDAESLNRMFPNLMFDPERFVEGTPK